MCNLSSTKLLIKTEKYSSNFEPNERYVVKFDLIINYDADTFFCDFFSLSS